MNNFQFLSLILLIISTNVVHSFSKENSNTQYSNSNNKEKDNKIDYNFLKQFTSMKKKMQSEGSKFTNFGIKFITKSNRFVVSNENIKNNTEIESIPFKSLLNIRNPKIKKFCQNLNIQNLKTEKSLYKNQYNCMVFWLLNQIKYTTKEYKLYIDSIPKSFHEYVYYWPKEDIKKVENTFWYNKKFSTGTNDLNEVIKDLKESNLNGKFTLSEIKRAELAVRSRNFELYVGKKEYHTLAPFTDMFNYNPNTNTEWTARLKNEKDRFVLKSIKPIKKGSEIYLDYGQEDNANYFSYYGFTLKNNPNESRTDYFVLKYHNKIFDELALEEAKSWYLPKIIQKLKNFDKKQKRKIPNGDYGKYEIGLFELLYKNLKSYKNVETIKKIEKNIKGSKNNFNILMTLKAEDKLITKNLKFIKEFITIIKEGKKSFKKNANLTIVKQNLKYFKELFRLVK